LSRLGSGPVTRETLLTPEASKDFNLGIVNFSPGARNKMHTHSSDQVLFVTGGASLPRKRNSRSSSQAMSCIFPRKEKHWHGATHDSAFSHICLDGER